MNLFVKRSVTLSCLFCQDMEGLGVTDDCEQKFDFGFEEEESIEGMKKLIVEEVNSFRAEVRAHARAAGQIRRQDRSTTRYPLYLHIA